MNARPTKHCILEFFFFHAFRHWKKKSRKKGNKETWRLRKRKKSCRLWAGREKEHILLLRSLSVIYSVSASSDATAPTDFPPHRAPHAPIVLAHQASTLFFIFHISVSLPGLKKNIPSKREKEREEKIPYGPRITGVREKVRDILKKEEKGKTN